MAIENGVDGALGGNAHITGKASNQKLADFARAPMRLIALEVDDEAFDLMRQLVGAAQAPARAVA